MYLFLFDLKICVKLHRIMSTSQLSYNQTNHTNIWLSLHLALVRRKYFNTKMYLFLYLHTHCIMSTSQLSYKQINHTHTHASFYTYYLWERNISNTPFFANITRLLFTDSSCSYIKHTRHYHVTAIDITAHLLPFKVHCLFSRTCNLFPPWYMYTFKIKLMWCNYTPNIILMWYMYTSNIILMWCTYTLNIILMWYTYTSDIILKGFTYISNIKLTWYTHVSNIVLIWYTFTSNIILIGYTYTANIILMWYTYTSKIIMIWFTYIYGV